MADGDVRLSCSGRRDLAGNCGRKKTLPQVYYVGLLAGRNDVDLLARSQVGRDVNRHHYTDAEINDAVQTPLGQALFRLIRFRNSHPAFDGEFETPAAART